MVDLESSSLCDVLLDSVIHSGHVAAIHAEQANCRQCREFVVKFRTDLKDLVSSYSGQDGEDQGGHHQDFFARQVRRNVSTYSS